MKKIKKNLNYLEYIEGNTIRLEASRRGGGIEIDVEELTGIEGAKMTAYQNYLGGGLLGRIASAKNFEPETKKEIKITEEITEVLKRYFHNITNGEAEDWDEWNGMDFEKNQRMPESAY